MMWQRFRELGKCSDMCNEHLAYDEVFRNEARTTLVEDWSTNPSVVQVMAALEELIEWGAKHTPCIDWKVPNSILIRSFLAAYHDRGETVPKTKLGHLRTREREIGLRACST